MTWTASPEQLRRARRVAAEEQAERMHAREALDHAITRAKREQARADLPRPRAPLPERVEQAKSALFGAEDPSLQRRIDAAREAVYGPRKGR